MKKRNLHILNWDKYQARSDKELPWLKLWGRLFKVPWFQIMPDDEKFVTIALLDLARQFRNNMPDYLIFKGYLRGNYGIFMDDLRIFKLCKSLSDNGFLSDNCPTNVEVEGDKIRVDKSQSDKSDKSDLSVLFDFLKIESFKKAFASFLDMRKKLNKTATEHAQKLILKKLHQYDHSTATKMLEQSIEGSWTGIYELKNNQAKQQQQSRPFPVGEYFGANS